MPYIMKTGLWLAAGLLLLQGCMTVGVYQVKVLSYTGGVIQPRATPLPVVAGVRFDRSDDAPKNSAKDDAKDAHKDTTSDETPDETPNGANDASKDTAPKDVIKDAPKDAPKDEAATTPPTSKAERFVLGSLAAELSASNLFQQVTYPTSGGEDVIFKITTWGQRHGPLSNPPLAVAQVFICTVTVLILCPPVSATYEYDIFVRAETEPGHISMGGYLARGKSRTRYGFLSSADADTVGWQAAATSAFDDLMRAVRRDENGWMVGAVR